MIRGLAVPAVLAIVAITVSTGLDANAASPNPGQRNGKVPMAETCIGGGDAHLPGTLQIESPAWSESAASDEVERTSSGIRCFIV